MNILRYAILTQAYVGLMLLHFILFISTWFASVSHRIHDQGWRRMRYPSLWDSKGVHLDSHIYILRCIYSMFLFQYHIRYLFYFTTPSGMGFISFVIHLRIVYDDLKPVFMVSYPQVMPSRSLRGGSRDSLHGRSWSVTGQLKVSTVGFQKKDWYRESDVWAANFWSSNSGFLLFICGSLFNAYVVFVDHSFNNEFYDNEIMFNRFLVGSVCMVGVFGGQLMAVRSS